ncbi:MAG: HAD-IIIA family hydrolase [Gammaproteobacteria bacterium]|nr:HAD-IIIA family hydrolase [Gammaproteobacteria bacterium]
MHEDQLVHLQRPTQAVILAGGRGTRLRPITDTRPKAMVEIHGKPFLEYLVEMLRDQGFDRILLLLGYLPEVIQNYFGDGKRWGVKLEYSVSAVEDETSRRMKLAMPLLDPCLLLMYCDNYWPMQIDKMWRKFTSAKVPAMITVYSNKDGYTTNSIRVNKNGFVTVFDKSCTSPNLLGVEISYAFITKRLVEELSEDNVPFEVAVYPRLAEQRQLLAYVTDHRYYSIGSHRRLPLTEAFLARRPTVILDRDGVLNKKPERAHYVRSWDEFSWLPGAKDALRLLKEAHYRVIVVSNQAGIGRGAMTEADLSHIHQQMQSEVANYGAHIEAIYYCPHDWGEGCDCRKPKPGMLFQVQRDLSLDLSRTLFIGDDERDAQAADAAGCPSALVSDHLTLLDLTRNLVNGAH